MITAITDEEPKHHCSTCHYFKFKNSYRTDRYTEICGFCTNGEITVNSGERVMINEVCELWSPNTRQESLEIALTAMQKCLDEIKKLLGKDK